MKKKILFWTLGIILLLMICLIGASEYFIHYALHNDTSGYDIKKEYAFIEGECPWIKHWADSINETKALRDTFAMNRDGLKIHAYYLPSPDSTAHTAVIVHGYKSNAIGMMHIGYMFNHDLHYNILLPDLVAHGKSEGEWISMGWKDRLDVMQWIRIAHGRFPDSDIVVHGISMGGATTMFVGGENTPDYVKAFIDDCGYSSVWDEFHGELKKQFGLPSFPLLDATNIVCKVQLGWSFREASAIDQVKKCQKPMLFIHGDNDDYVPTAMVHPLYEAKPQPKELYLTKGSDHAHSYRDHHEEYTEKVRQFLTQHQL